MAAQDELANVLYNDKLARQGNNSNLYGLEDINFKNDWVYTYPTIFSPDAATNRTSVITEQELFNTIFHQKYGVLLSKVDYSNILIAGGAVGSTLLQKDLNNDVDIFIYGLNPDQATEKIINLIQQIYESYEDAMIKKQHSNEDETTDDQIESLVANLRTKRHMNNTRNKYCINIEFKEAPISRSKHNIVEFIPDAKVYKIQIILRLYKNISEILHGFDMGSSAIGYDGQRLYFTDLGKFAYEYSANIVDPSRRSTTYEYRLYKYFRRGFHIILPDFDIKKLRTDYLKYGLDEVCQLPYFPFTYKQVKGNKIYLHRLLTKENSERSERSDYQDYINEYKIFYLNLKNLVKNDDNYYYYSEQMNFDIITIPPYISRSRIIDFYDTLEKKMYYRLKVKTLSNYFSEPVLSQLFMAMVKESGSEVISSLIEQQKEIILSRFDTMQNSNHASVQWMTQNPGTQISGSFNPILSDPADWYGMYYLGHDSKTSTSQIRVAKPQPSTLNRSIAPSIGNSYLQVTPKQTPGNRTTALYMPNKATALYIPDNAKSMLGF